MQDSESLLSSLRLNMPLFEEMQSFTGKKYEEMILNQANRPASMSYFDHAVLESERARIGEIIEAREHGAKMIGTFCIYVPDEIVYAASAIPVALCGGTSLSVPYAERKFPRDICPLIKSTLGRAFSRTCPYAPLEDMGVGETTCDAKKKTWDILSQKSRFHILELPQKKNGRDAGLWREEVREFRDAVENLTGNKVTSEKLGDSIRLMNRKRKLLLELNEFRKLPLPPISGRDALVVMQVALNDERERFCNRLEALVNEIHSRAGNEISQFPEGTVRVLVTGCPSVMGNWKLHSIIETSGAAVVCDESCTGTRYFERMVDENAKTAEDMIDAIADRYFKINCSCFTPNNERIEHVVELAKEYKADVVIQYVLHYCHTYAIEAMRITEALKTAGIPSMVIETDYSDEDEGQLRTRIEALLERVKN
jgi:benzoyl-CoA reductase/2-hydroxyglutaryl-CoA dehydratase subunit BcrC/BadD/HgdB